MTTRLPDDIIKTLLACDAPMLLSDRQRILDRIHQLEREIAGIQHDRSVETNHLSAVAALVADDCHAVTFQSLGQYRRNIMKFIAKHQDAYHD